jgi:hypothetical protein
MKNQENKRKRCLSTQRKRLFQEYHGKLSRKVLKSLAKSELKLEKMDQET